MAEITPLYRKQYTLKKSVSFSGIGVHTGKEVTMRFCPMPVGSGIVFARMDLPSFPIIPALVDYVCEMRRCTTIGIGQIKVHTIEHVMAALKAYDIDNLRIELTDEEPPIADGSSECFVRMIEEAGVLEQDASVKIAKITKPLYWSDNEISLVALPYDGFKISYTLNYPKVKLLRAQYYSVLVNKENFCKEIAPCRTFSLYEEVAHLIDRGLIRGGSLDNAVIIKEDVVFSKEGLRFDDEMVRHKILDVIGDLSLVGIPFHAHIIAIRSGHASNNKLAKEIHQSIMENNEHI